MEGITIKLPILVYHRIITDKTYLEGIPAVERPYCLSEGKYLEHLDYLQSQGYTGISISEVYGVKTSRVVGITFDDGFESDFFKAFPELEKRGFRATFYIVTGYVGKKDYMNWAQIKELKRRGMEIGSHSISHRYLLDLDYQTISNEFFQSKETLEGKLGEPVDSFSVPYGFVNQKIINIAFEVGYQTVCTSDTRLAKSVTLPKVYGRYGIRRTDSLQTFKGIVNRRTSTLLKIALKEEGKNNIKHIVGRRLWLAFREKLLSRMNDFK